ncbi:MAG: protein ral secretion pathway protein [Candidatus Parcubacteria bacterium]|jgi:prepilin-type N-terminal cleavage/methylation domain-containing protein
MLHTINTKRARGFTLIELLVVIAIIGLLSTIIAAPIQNARKKARDAKKIAELKSLQLAIEQYAEANDSNYPKDLAVSLSPAYMPLLPTFTASTTSTARDTYAYTYYEASASGAATSTFAYHIGSKLEVFGPALDTDRDCIDGYLGAALLDPYCSVYNGDSLTATLIDNGRAIISSTTPSGTDFGGYRVGADLSSTAGRDEIATSTCKDIQDCIFDITSQQ